MMGGYQTCSMQLSHWVTGKMRKERVGCERSGEMVIMDCEAEKCNVRSRGDDHRTSIQK